MPSSTVTVSLIALVSIILLIVIFLWFRSSNYRYKLTTTLKSISYDRLENVSIDLDLDHNAHFDYVLLGKQGVIVISLKDYPGKIYAANDINEWTQVIGTRSFRFGNPLFDLMQNVEWLKTVSPDIDIEGIVLFTDKSDFPTSKPENVLKLDELKQRYQKVRGKTIPEEWLQSWNQIRNRLAS